jgi:hypothetical protein
MSMALTINPAGSGTRGRWLADAGSFFAGVLVGALTSAAVVMGVVGLLSLLVPGAWLPLLVLPLAVPVALRELGLQVPVPYRNQQVPEWWRSVLPTGAVALAYGLMLGVGFATLFVTSAHLVVLLALPFVGSAWALLGVVAAFAAGKTLVLYLAEGTSSHGDVIARLSVAESTSTTSRWARRVTGLGASALILATLLHVGPLS